MSLASLHENLVIEVIGDVKGMRMVRLMEKSVTVGFSHQPIPIKHAIVGIQGCCKRK